MHGHGLFPVGGAGTGVGGAVSVIASAVAAAIDLAAWGGAVLGHPVGAVFLAADVVVISARAGQVTSPGQGIIRL